MRALLTISYDGTDYCGWQRQNGQPTVQQVIESGISKLYGEDIIILGASRTDSGVHAFGQMATFTPPDDRIPFETLHLAINSNLPRNVRILSSQPVPDSFHVINDVKRKTYIYKIQNGTVYNPVLYRYTHHIPEQLDIELMKEAASFFLGEHDFKAFCASHSSASTTVRTIFELNLLQKDGVISAEICGNGFLYNMIRIIMGTLVSVGSGRTEPSRVKEIIMSGEREKAGATLPAKGLTLINIEY